MPQPRSIVKADLPPAVELFMSWLRDKPRLPYIYHRGNLMNDRKNPEVRVVAAVALEAFEQGRVELMQRRVREGEYHYIAMPRRAVHKKREQTWRTKRLLRQTTQTPQR